LSVSRNADEKNGAVVFLRKPRWGDPLDAEKMKKAVWLRPEAVAQIAFLEWTDADRLRHSKFAGLRDGKDARNVVKECPAG
jgi:ATP-dependent DNA ligase